MPVKITFLRSPKPGNEVSSSPRPPSTTKRNKTARRGQASLEYIVMLSLSLAVFSSILYVSTSLLSSSTTQIGIDAAARGVSQMKEAADFVYVHGHPSKTQVNVYVPPNIENVTIDNQTIRFRISVGPAYTDVYSISRANLTANVCPNDQSCMQKHEGYYLLNVESTNNLPPSTSLWSKMARRAQASVEFMLVASLIIVFFLIIMHSPMCPR